MSKQLTTREMVIVIEAEVKGIHKEMRDQNGSIKTIIEDVKDNRHDIDVMTGKATVIGGIMALIGAGVISFINGIWGK